MDSYQALNIADRDGYFLYVIVDSPIMEILPNGNRSPEYRWTVKDIGSWIHEIRLGKGPRSQRKQTMKIKNIELHKIAIPFIQPYKLSKVYGTLTYANAVIVKITTDTGIVGWGEADPMAPFTKDTPESVIATIRDQVAAQVLGQDPTQITRLEAKMDHTVDGSLMARGAVNMALFDILGKTHELPAHTFLGGLIHERLPLLGPIGSGTPKEDAAAIEKMIGEGYGTIMIKMGALPIFRETERMISACRKFGDRIIFIADANQGWEYDEALQFMEGIRGCEPFMIEQPIDRNNIGGMKDICKRANCLISADESLVSADEAERLMRTGAAHVFSIKVSKNGGLTKSRMIANAAELAGVKCLMNSMLEFGITQAASLQLGCTLNNLMDCGHAYMSVLRMADDITDFSQNITDAVVNIPKTPGLGIEVNPRKLEQYTSNYIKL